MRKHIRAFKDYEEYKNADLVFPSVAYIEETPSEIGKGVLYEKYEPPTIIARGTVTIPELPEGVTKEQVESMIAGQGFFIPIHLEYRDAAGNIMDEALIPELSRQFTSFKVNGEETLKREPTVELGTVNPVAVEISEAAQGPLFTEESLIMGASKLNVKFSKTPYILGLHLYLEALGGSINLGVPLEVWVTEEPFNSFLEIISDTEFNLDVKALVDLLSAELPGLDYTTVKSTLWGADEGSTIEDINSFSPTVNGYLGGSLTTGNTKMWWNSGEYEVIMKFDRNSKPCLDYLFYGSLCSWKEIEFRGTFNNDIELPYYTWVGPKSNTTHFTTDSGSFPEESLEKVILPESLKTIKSRTFSGFTNLSVIGLPESIENIGQSTFSGCSSLTTITIPESVTSIEEYAFNNCSSLTTINIPENSQLTSIGGGAFSGTTWYNNQPDGVVYIGKMIYKYKGNMPENTSIEVKEGIVGIAGSAFSGRDNLITITIPNSMTNIGAYAFDGCRSLTTVIIPENSKLTSISSSTFKDCYRLTTVNIPEGVTSIGQSAFSRCYSLTDITFPESLMSIGMFAFEYCNLTSIICKAVIPPTHPGAFVDVDRSIPVYVPAGSVESYKAHERWGVFTNIQAIS